MFEARASPGGVIRGDEILEEARATRGVISHLFMIFWIRCDDEIPIHISFLLLSILRNCEIY